MTDERLATPKRRLESRRTFLRWVAGSTAAIAGYWAYHWFFGDPTNITIAVLKRRCGDLYVHHDTFVRFANDYAQWKGRKRLLSRLSGLALPLRIATPYPWLAPKSALRKLEDSVVSTYLLSTDFFLHDGDMTREIQYLSFYDPMNAICRNPFVRPIAQ